MEGSYDVIEVLSQHLYGSQRKKYEKHPSGSPFSLLRFKLCIACIQIKQTCWFNLPDYHPCYI